MRRDARILLATVALGGAIYGYEWLRGMASEMKTFRVSEVDVRGTRYLEDDEVVRTMRLTEESSVWTDTRIWEERLATHPMVREVEVRRRLPGGLRVEVTERDPVALTPTPTLEPVDAEGYLLPLDPSRYRLDLPVLATGKIPAKGARLAPDEVRRLAAEVGRLMSADTAFLQRVSEFGWTRTGDLDVTWTEPEVSFLLRPGTPPSRLREGLGALADALRRAPAEEPDVIDLRFADQVVVRRTPER